MRLLLLATILLSGGCARFNVQTPLSARAPVVVGQEQALLGVLMQGYKECIPQPGNAALQPCAAIDNFLGAGLTLSDIYCDDFFRSANTSARKRRFSRGLATDSGAAISGLLNLAKASANALTASAVGFAAIDSTFRNYDDSFMVDPDLSKIRSLVLSAQDNMKLAIDASPPKTIYAAESKIRRYAGLCSFLGMQGLLNTSIAEKTARIETVNKATTKAVMDTTTGDGADTGDRVGAVPSSDPGDRLPPAPVAPAAMTPLQQVAPVAPLPPPG